jgi:para-nitrobenzyl esterase
MRKLLAALGIAPQDWRKLLDVPAAAIVKAQAGIGGAPGAGVAPTDGCAGPLQNVVGVIAPVRDGVLLPHHPFDPGAPAISRDKPLMVGWNKDEQHFFSVSNRDIAAWSLDEAGLMKRIQTQFGGAAPDVVSTYRAAQPGATPSDLYFAIESDLFAGVGSEVIAERKARQGGAPVFRYTLTYEQGGTIPGTPVKLGALHALDIAMKFDNPDAQVPGFPPLGGPRPERHVVARTMSTMWASFARTGRPSAAGQPAWPAYDLNTRATMCIDVHSHVENDPHRRQRLFWETRA